MNTRPLILATLAFAALCSPMTAFSASPPDRLGLGNAKDGEASDTNTFWTCIVGCPKQAVTMIKLATITSVSKQTYMLDNSIKMLEVTIDTIGNNTIRFYCTNSEQVNKASSRLSNTRALLDEKTGGATRYPGKKYPEGTHSHNIEYQVSGTDAIDTIYDSIANAWVKNKGCTLKVN